MVAFANGVFRILQRVATYRAVAVDKSTGTVLNDRVPSAVVGPDAARWCDEHPDRFMMFANSPYCFLRPLAPRKRARS
ncbi:MAG: hypothetical protein IPJ30_14920 [Acidobacteria bacterium]|nr:hypothetical protein [Acidobacteriota bacterium]